MSDVNTKVESTLKATITIRAPSALKVSAVTTNANISTSVNAKIGNKVLAEAETQIPNQLKADFIVGGGGGIQTNHAKLKNLDYESSGHTGFASQEELKQYVKASELAKVAKTGNHDDLIGNPAPLTNLEIENILKGV